VINFLKKNICQNKVVAKCIIAYLYEGFHTVVKDNGIWAEKTLMFLLAENPIFTIEKSFLTGLHWILNSLKNSNITCCAFSIN